MTQDFVRRPSLCRTGCLVPQLVPKRGYGAALPGGFDAARGKFIPMADADGSYSRDALPRFVEPLRAVSALVIGSRFGAKRRPGRAGGNSALPKLIREEEKDHVQSDSGGDQDQVNEEGKQSEIDGSTATAILLGMVPPESGKVVCSGS